MLLSSFAIYTLKIKHIKCTAYFKKILTSEGIPNLSTLFYYI